MNFDTVLWHVFIALFENFGVHVVCQSKEGTYSNEIAVKFCQLPAFIENPIVILSNWVYCT